MAVDPRGVNAKREVINGQRASFYGLIRTRRLTATVNSKVEMNHEQ